MKILRKIWIGLIFFSLVLVLFSGCKERWLGFRKEAKEEKEIFGFLDGYNPRIKELERYLVNAGFNPGALDGKIDKKTREALRVFQKANSLKVTGFIDSNTWKKLNSLGREKETRSTAQLNNKEVYKIQKALKNAGFNPGSIDGKMGDKTKKAIADFQKANGLSANGSIDAKTKEKLSRYYPKEQTL